MPWYARLVLALFFSGARSDYWSMRSELIDSDFAYSVGANVKLNEREQELNGVLMRHKRREFDEGFNDPEKFLPAKHFFEAKELIEQSEVFHLIKQLPKGASLHSHDTASASGEYLYSLTFRPDLYACVQFDNLKLKFFGTPPGNDGCEWMLVSERRKTDANFDQFLRGQLTLEVQNPKQKYPDINAVWQKFMRVFSTVIPMITYKPIFQEYFYNVLQEFYNDNVMYVEFRGTLPPVYDLTGHIYTKLEIAGMYENTTTTFKNNNKGFIGVRFIYGPARKIDNATMESHMETAKMLKQAYPDFVAGFDLVGQEDLGRPLKDFINELKVISKSMNLYFHAGETNWYGSTTDFNLIDAIMLGTKRIGHGFAIVKHPLIMSMIKERKIGVEIAPISNQVLMLVDDIRNHPGNVMIAAGLPVVICNDDPGFWGAKGLSYDWYMAFMGMTSREADLAFLKQIAMNSFLYSGLEERAKRRALRQWDRDWQSFVVKMLNYYSHKLNEQ